MEKLLKLWYLAQDLRKIPFIDNILVVPQPIMSTTDYRELSDSYGLTFKQAYMLFGPYKCNGARTNLQMAQFIENFVTAQFAVGPRSNDIDKSNFIEDVKVFGKNVYVYCDQHLAAHMTGWCTVSAKNKIKLEAKDYNAALMECKIKGYKLYKDLHCS